MIGKGKSIAHIANALDYARNKDNAVEIDRNLVSGDNGKEIANEFRIFQQLNSRCINNAFSFVVSPEIEIGRSLSKNDFRQITQEFLKELNLNEHQYICYLHEANHRHLHIFVNRLNQAGTAYKDNFIGKKAQKAAENIAKERGFITAKEIQIEREDQLRATVEYAHNEALKQSPKSIEEYANFVAKYNIETKLKHANNGKLVGISFQVGNQTIKGSAVHKSMSAKNLQETIDKTLKFKNNHNKKSI